MATNCKWVAFTQEFFDGDSRETVARLAPLAFSDDFIGRGKLTVPGMTRDEAAQAQVAWPNMGWMKKIVGVAPPTVAGVASAIGGQIACALTAASEKQDAVLYWGNQKGLDITKGLVFETRIRLSVLPSAAGVQAVAGVCSDWIDGPDNNACYARFQANSSGLLYFRCFDGVTTTSVSTGVTLAASDWAILRIDASDIANVRFFVNGAQVSPENAVSFAATGALAVLQPYLGVYKPSGTGVATLITDCVRAWQSR